MGRDGYSPRKDVCFEQDDVEPLASKCRGCVRPARSTANDEDLTFGWDGRHGLAGLVGEMAVGMGVKSKVLGRIFARKARVILLIPEMRHVISGQSPSWNTLYEATITEKTR